MVSCYFNSLKTAKNWAVVLHILLSEMQIKNNTCFLGKWGILFGDVVTFDTTYKINCYELIFATFIGCNHLSQTTLFGCGLLPNEKNESFEWLFNKQLEAMSFSPPRGIITDHDLAITKAIKNVMPNTCHRYYLRNILDKLLSNLGGVLIHNEGLIDEIKKCVHNCKTPPREFPFQC